MDVITSDTDTLPSTTPGSDKHIEMFERGMSTGPEMSMTDFMEFAAATYGGGSIQKAMQIAAFMLCCDVISQDIAKSTLRLRERLMNGTSRVVHPTQHPIAGLLALEPNRRHTWIQYHEMTVLWSCLTSNSFSVVFRDAVGNPLELVPVQTGRVHEKISGREVFYDVQSSTEQERALLGSAYMTVAERDMVHVRRRMLDGMDGYSTLDAGKNTLSTAAALDAFRSKIFAEDGQIRGVFTREKDGAMDEIAFQRLRQQFRILLSKFKQNTDPIVLEDGIKFDPIASKPSDIELVKQFEAQINEVCRLLRVPPHKVFLMTGTKYENLETQEKMYVGDTLVPVAEHHEQSMGRVLLTPKDRLRYYLEYDRAEMTLRDTKLETDRAIRGLERGALEVDEARAVFGYNPLPKGAGQVRLVPANMVLIDRSNKIVVSASSMQEDPATEEPVAGDDEAAQEESQKAFSDAVVRLVHSN